MDMSYIYVLFVLAAATPLFADPDGYEVDRRCDDNICYILYAANNTVGVEWGDSKIICDSAGLQFAAIPDVSSQKLIEDWLGGLDTDGIWVSGQRSRGDWHWRYLNGTKLSQDIGTQDSVRDGRFCAAAHLDRPVRYTDEQCEDTTSGAAVVCQYKGPCQDTFRLRDLCFAVSSHTNKTWYDAVNICRDEYQGTVMYSYLEEGHDLDKIKEHTTQFWVGINSVQWKWRQNLITFVEYFNWDRSADYHNGDSMYLLKDTMKWKNRRYAMPLKHLLCSEEIIQFIGTTESAENASPRNDINSSVVDNGVGNGFPVIAVAVAVPLLLVIIIVIVVIVVCVRKEKTHSKSENSRTMAEDVGMSQMTDNVVYSGQQPSDDEFPYDVTRPSTYKPSPAQMHDNEAYATSHTLDEGHQQNVESDSRPEAPRVKSTILENGDVYSLPLKKRGSDKQ